MRFNDNHPKILATVHHLMASHLDEKHFVGALRKEIDINDPTPIVCIGTDRATGDAFGPILGSLLQSIAPDIPVYGTLQDPVHATNLHNLTQKYGWQKRKVLAVDACLGEAKNVGNIRLMGTPLVPGSGVNKETLPRLGPPSILAVVNIGGFMEYLVLQNTRLQLVLSMVRVTAKLILRAYGVRTRRLDNNFFASVVEAVGTAAPAKEDVI